MSPGESPGADRLAEVALHAFEAPNGFPAWGPVGSALRQIGHLAGSAPDADLAAWAARVAAPGGELPLLGTAVRAAGYVALSWNGERLRRAGAGRDAGLTLVGLAVGAEHGRDAGSLVGAVRGGLAVADALDRWLAGDGGGVETAPVAVPTTDAVAAAACAALLAGTPRDEMAEVLDMSGSLMLITPPGAAGAGAYAEGASAQAEDASAYAEGAWAGHALAAGWLAIRARVAGFAGFAGGLAHTLSVVTGRKAPQGTPGAAVIPPAAPPLPALLERPPTAVTVRSLLGALG